MLSRVYYHATHADKAWPCACVCFISNNSTNIALTWFRCHIAFMQLFLSLFFHCTWFTQKKKKQITKTHVCSVTASAVSRMWLLVCFLLLLLLSLKQNTRTCAEKSIGAAKNANKLTKRKWQISNQQTRIAKRPSTKRVAFSVFLFAWQNLILMTGFPGNALFSCFFCVLFFYVCAASLCVAAVTSTSSSFFCSWSNLKTERQEGE